MGEQIAEGFIGLFLFISHWLSPGAGDEEIRIAAIEQLHDSIRIECAISINWSEQLADLIDAGIPLRFRMGASGSAGDSVGFIRTLQFDIAAMSYCFSDSVISGPHPGTVQKSRVYNQALIALRDYCRWSVVMRSNCSSYYLEATLLPSRASRLNRTVDMSNVCACRSFTRSIVLGQDSKQRRGMRQKKTTPQ